MDFFSALANKSVNLNWLFTGQGEMYVTDQDWKELLAPEFQHLLHEVSNYPRLASQFAALARRIKEGAQIESELHKELERLKDAASKGQRPSEKPKTKRK